VSERDLKKLSDMILTSVSSLFGFGKVTMVVYDESLGAFQWMAVFGYSDEVAKEIRHRSIPIEVVLEDLREIRRIGRSAYFTPVESLSPSQRAHFIRPRGPPEKPLPSRTKDEFRDGDCLAFALHDSAGRVVGVVYPSEPRDGKLPDKDTIETMEILSSLAEVAVENARLTIEREQALRLSSQRTEQLSRILDVTSAIMVVRNLDQTLDDLLRTLAHLLGIKRMVLGMRHEELGVYRIEAVYGYSAKSTEAIKKIAYSIDEVHSILAQSSLDVLDSRPKWRKKVGRMTYYVPAESYSISPNEMAYYPEPELTRLPRKGKGHWHELDYLDTFIFDKNGTPIAYLEILKPRDERVPDSDTIEIVEIFASLAGIAIENARMFQEHIDSRKNAELFTDILSHDIKNFNQAIIGYLDLLRSRLSQPDNRASIDKIAEQVMNTSRLASNVRTMSRMTFGEVGLSRMDLGAVLQECIRSLQQYYPARKVVVKHDIERGVYYVAADELIRELFTNILTNAAKYDSHEVVEIDLSVSSRHDGGHKSWVVSVADHGRGIPDDIKSIIFDRFSKAPRKKGSGMGLHIVKMLSMRYGGRVWVEDRVPRDHTKGSLFKVELPAVE
ncbi:MAG: GAF domain-containing sensor histidine kinase, partial [Thermoplasmata archaeon]